MLVTSAWIDLPLEAVLLFARLGGGVDPEGDNRSGRANVKPILVGRTE